MKKFCVFCGEKPVSKNREHVVPEWLIRLTGDPNRAVTLVQDWAHFGETPRKYAFDHFTFPACEACNASFSDLEVRAKAVIEAILACSAVSAEGWSLLLDWLDKVRVGIWLGLIYMNENPFHIRPEFHIQRRIVTSDRFVIVYRLEEDGFEGLSWSGMTTPIFECMPSCPGWSALARGGPREQPRPPSPRKPWR